MPDDVAGVGAAMPPIRSGPEMFYGLPKAAAVKEEGKEPLQLARLRQERPALLPCGPLDHMTASAVEHVARGLLVVVPVPPQALQPLHRVALVEVPQADGEHHDSALPNGLGRGLPGVLPPAPMLYKNQKSAGPTGHETY